MQFLVPYDNSEHYIYSYQKGIDVAPEKRAALPLKTDTAYNPCPGVDPVVTSEQEDLLHLCEEAENRVNGNLGPCSCIGTKIKGRITIVEVKNRHESRYQRKRYLFLVRKREDECHSYWQEKGRCGLTVVVICMNTKIDSNGAVEGLLNREPDISTGYEKGIVPEEKVGTYMGGKSREPVVSFTASLLCLTEK